MSAHRIIDANANRAREALRVMEDVARFTLNDADLCAQLKQLRHDLATALSALSGGDGTLLAWRDTPGDVGTSGQTITEYKRTGTRDIVIAAGKRLSEALRSIEEHSKSLEGGIAVAQQVEQIRYRAYDLEQRLVLAMGTGRAVQWKLCTLVTEGLCRHHDWLTVAREAARGGADCIQLREPELDDGELIDRARRLVETIKPLGASVIINNRADVALLAGADGVHVGQNDMSAGDVRRIAGFDMLVGVSTCNIEQAQRALRDGADYCGVGPMFSSTTKHKDVIVGPGYMREYARHELALPVHLAIGGITPSNVEEVVAAGAKGIAVSSCVCGSERPGEVCERLREIIETKAPVSLS